MYCAYYYNILLGLCGKSTNFVFTIVFLLFSHSVMSNSLWPCLWDFLGKNTGVGCHFFSRGSSRPRDRTCLPCLLHCRWILYLLRYWGSHTFDCKKNFQGFYWGDSKIIKCGSLNLISDYLLGSTTLGTEVAQKSIRQVVPYHWARRNCSPAEVTSNSGYQRLQGKGKSLGMSGQQQSRMLYENGSQ